MLEFGADSARLKSALSDVTFLVTVRERCKHLRRALDYYSRFPVRVLVMDCSDRPCRIDRCPIDFRHLHLPNRFIVDALLAALAEVDTPYCVIASDDDFFIPRSVAVLVEALRNDPQVVSAQGVYGRFENGAEMGLQEAYPHMAGYDVLAEAPEARVIGHLSHYVTHYHAVHRTEQLRAAIRAGRPFTNFSANEVVTAAVAASLGKLRVLPILYCVRETIATSQSALLQRKVGGKVKFAEAVAKPNEHQALLKDCEDAVCGALEAEGVAPETARGSVREAFEGFGAFMANYKARAARWQAHMRDAGMPNFSDILAEPETRQDWELIRTIVKDHNLSPFVPPLLVDDEGRRIRTWQDSPVLFNAAVLMRKWAQSRVLGRAFAGVRYVLRHLFPARLRLLLKR